MWIFLTRAVSEKIALYLFDRNQEDKQKPLPQPLVSCRDRDSIVKFCVMCTSSDRAVLGLAVVAVAVAVVA